MELHIGPKMHFNQLIDIYLLFLQVSSIQAGSMYAQLESLLNTKIRKNSYKLDKEMINGSNDSYQLFTVLYMNTYFYYCLRRSLYCTAIWFCQLANDDQSTV
jgi:hypothetical protein